MSETWYVLEDGAVGDPRECRPDKTGKLRHRDGRAVAYAPHGPRSRGGVDAVAERAKAVARAAAAAAPVVRHPVVAPAPEPVAARDLPSPLDRELTAETAEAPRAKRTYNRRSGV